MTEPNPYGCQSFCRAPGIAICPKCEPAVWARYHPGNLEADR